MAGAPAKPKPRAPRKPARPPGLAHGRWLGDFDPPPTAAEMELIGCCGRGEVWAPEGRDGERPEESTENNTIRGEIIRYLALGGDCIHPVHQLGVMARGVWISGVLDLHQCKTAIRIALSRCHFVAAPNFIGARIPELALRGCLVPGLLGDRLEVDGGIFFDHDFSALGEVRLRSAQIGGDLSCNGSSFVNPGGIALSADGVQVKGCIFLSDSFAAQGQVRLGVAIIGGQLDCNEGSFNHLESYALFADDLVLAGSLYLRDAKIEGSVSIASGRVGTLIDDSTECWKAGGHGLDGFQYERILGVVDAKTRIKWLKGQRTDQLNSENWAPQPWEQLIKVLREMGHPHEAAEVAMEKQRMMRKAKRVGGLLAVAWHHIYEWLAGFGYKPGRILLWMALVWGLSGLWYGHAAQTGLFAPTSGEVIMHRQVHADLGGPNHVAGNHAGQCGLRHEVAEAQYWPQCTALPSEYTTFNPWLYSLDLILPLVDLQQDSDWSPAASFTDAKGRSGDLIEGQRTRALMWFEILFGWFASLMFVAIVSRLVEKD